MARKTESVTFVPDYQTHTVCVNCRVPLTPGRIRQMLSLCAICQSRREECAAYVESIGEEY